MKLIIILYSVPNLSKPVTAFPKQKLMLLPQVNEYPQIKLLYFQPTVSVELTARLRFQAGTFDAIDYDRTCMIEQMGGLMIGDENFSLSVPMSEKRISPCSNCAQFIIVVVGAMPSVTWIRTRGNDKRKQLFQQKMTYIKQELVRQLSKKPINALSPILSILARVQYSGVSSCQKNTVSLCINDEVGR